MNSLNWKRIKRVVTISAFALVTTVGFSEAAAAPKVGESIPRARVESIDGKVFDTGATAGKTVLVFYESKEASRQNQAFKLELATLRKTVGFKSEVRVVAIADVSGFDYWPAKGLAKDAIKAEQQKTGQTIYCDWTGAFGTSFKVKKGVSNVVLVGGDGKVLLSHEGALNAEAKEKIKAALRASP